MSVFMLLVFMRVRPWPWRQLTLGHQHGLLTVRLVFFVRLAGL